ncbi:MAG: AAA family ATPase [Desulfobacterales bacterium]|nr:AAA family ATPase [Desulfobacterales bacterium]
MTLLNSILNWSKTKLPLWQQDAVRRFFQQENGLSNDDYTELYTLMKADYGLPNPHNPKLKPLTSAHLPATLKTGETVVIEALRELKYVNLISPEERLNFEPNGMTIIYGGNGSGKSGYACVMKRACRARDQVEKVHPNANDPAVQHCMPEATFDIQINGTSKSVQWSLGKVSPVELATFAFFDSYCARAYLTTEQDVAYLPYGLDVIESFANKVLPELKRRLDEEIAGINTDCQPFFHLHGETEVGNLISSINHKTCPEKIKSLGKLSVQKKNRISELDSALAEANPKTKAMDLRLSAERLRDLTERIETALFWVSDDAIKNLRESDKNAIAANIAEDQAAEALQSGEILLAGTGGQVWKELFNAARKFSTEVAYPEYRFPHIVDSSVCPLCQQPLRKAGKRLKRFEEYIRNDVAKNATQQRQKVGTEKKKIEIANLSIGLDKSIVEELKNIDEVLANSIISFQKGIDARRSWMLEALKSHDWDTVPTLGENPCHNLLNVAAYKLKSAKTFERAANDVKRKALEVEREELRACKNLSICLDAVLAMIENMKKKHALELCNKGLRTKPISDQSKEFASNAVTATLKNALDNEFKSLGIGHIKTKLKERNKKGKIKHQLLLDLPTSNKLEEILSEGEQRAIALGSFLAELQLANHSGGIIFDDPVSSLDHKRRGKFAKRLASESMKRQVLVFTHEVVFLQQLRDECKKLEILHSICFLEMAGGYSGIVTNGLPWIHKSVGERIDSLEKAQKHFEKLPWPADPSEKLASEIIRQYSFFRATIERVVQDLMLNATVQRFRDYIDIKRLDKVVGLEKIEVDEVYRLYQRCNSIVEAHDPSSAKEESPPTPDELRNDIDDLKKLIKKINDRRK